MDKENWLDRWLSELEDSRATVTIYVHSGVRLTGHVVAFDDEVIVLDTDTGSMPINRTFGWTSIKEL